MKRGSRCRWHDFKVDESRSEHDRQDDGTPWVNLLKRHIENQIDIEEGTLVALISKKPFQSAACVLFIAVSIVIHESTLLFPTFNWISLFLIKLFVRRISSNFFAHEFRNNESPYISLQYNFFFFFFSFSLHLFSFCLSAFSFYLFCIFDFVQHHGLNSPQSYFLRILFTSPDWIASTRTNIFWVSLLSYTPAHYIHIAWKDNG